MHIRFQHSQRKGAKLNRAVTSHYGAIQTFKVDDKLSAFQRLQSNGSVNSKRNYVFFIRYPFTDAHATNQQTCGHICH